MAEIRFACITKVVQVIQEKVIYHDVRDLYYDCVSRWGVCERW